MRIFIHNKDIINVTEADTIVLPVDGSGPGLEGNTARRFMKHIGIEKMHEMYAPPPYYPFNGEAYWSQIAGVFDNTHFEWICCLGFLGHQVEASHKSTMRAALRHMLSSVGGDVGSRLACPILTGGPRIAPVDAIYIMTEEAERCSSRSAELHIAEIDAERFRLLQHIVR